MNFGLFLVRFLEIDRKTCQETRCTIKWKFFENKISRKLTKTKTFIFENFQEYQFQNTVEM